jgi:hypothetical protein
MMVGCAASTCLSGCDERVRVTAPAPPAHARPVPAAGPAGHGAAPGTGEFRVGEILRDAGIDPAPERTATTGPTSSAPRPGRRTRQHPPSQPSPRLTCLRTRRSATQSSIRAAQGPAIQERAVRDCPRKFAFDSRSASAHSRSPTAPAGVPGVPRYHQAPISK